MSINKRYVYLAGISYLALPILMFFLLWLKLGYGVTLTIMLVLSIMLFYKNINCSVDDYAKESILIDKYAVFSLVGLFVFLICTGHGGFFGSAGVDVPWRNAVYNDLIKESWPIIYEYSSSALVYYITYWLVPAGISCCLKLNWFYSNIVLFCWTYLGIILIYFMLCDYLNVTEKEQCIVTFLFVFWSGINIIGMIPKSIFDKNALSIDSLYGF